MIGRNELIMFLLLAVTLIGAAVILLVFLMGENMKTKKYILLFSFAATFIILGYYGGRYGTWNRAFFFFDDMTVSLREKLSGELEDREIYFIKNEEINLTSTNPKYFQFLIPERTIHVITAEETEQVFKQGGLIIINPEDGDMADLLESSEKVKKIDSSLLLTAYVVE